MMLLTAANTLLRILLAPACVACHRALERPLDGAVCPACWTAVPKLSPPLCDLCGDTLPPSTGVFRVCTRCLAEPLAFETARSAGMYAGSLRAVIHAFKYDRRRTLAAPLAHLMRVAGSDVLSGADAVVPVPLHPWRLMQRGFNQADDLAQHLGLPVWRVLRRTKPGPPQARLTARQRRMNVRDAFGCRMSLSGTGASSSLARLRHRTIVLVDDVLTTGATLDACSRVLTAAGTGSVRVLTVARTPPPLPPPPPH